ncbi:MAG: hypothetical protein LJE63_15990 [Desulfobacteraceae bacterium]|nr:hypothetical protein [Desulfobacteraceae bacterium]
MFKSVMVAYSILLLHVSVIAVLGILVLFFRGIVNYMLWIFLFGSTAIAVFAYLFFRRMKREGKSLREMLNTPVFNGRPVEVSLLGGLASFRLGGRPGFPALEGDYLGASHQLEDPDTVRLRELVELGRMFENNLITFEEFNQAKKKLLEA